MDWNEKLLESANNGNLDKVKECLANGADVNAKDNSQTALELVLGYKYPKERDLERDFEIVKYLVENGADVNAKYNYGTVLTVCFNTYPKINYEIVKFLIENGAEVDGYHLQRMVSYTDEVFKYFIQLKEVQCAFVGIANWHRSSSDSKQAIINIVSKCLKCGMDANVANDNGETAIMFACQKGYLDVVLILIAGKANVNAKDKNGKTVLNYAADGGNAEIVKLLLAQGADTGAKKQ